jgi:hypothetical protein
VLLLADYGASRLSPTTPGKNAKRSVTGMIRNTTGSIFDLAFLQLHRHGAQELHVRRSAVMNPYPDGVSGSTGDGRKKAGRGLVLAAVALAVSTVLVSARKEPNTLAAAILQAASLLLGL